MQSILSQLQEKTLLWRVGYFTRENEVRGSQLVAGFHLLIVLLVEKPIQNYFQKKKTLNLLGFRFLTLETAQNLLLETLHALTVRLGIGARHLQCVVRLNKSDVGACSPTCQVSSVAVVFN